MKKLILALILIALIMPTANASAPDFTPPEMAISATGVCDVNGWGWKEHYGTYEVANDRWNYLTVWYDPDELGYSTDHPYTSLSDEHVKNGTTIYPINELYTNEHGNTYIPFIFTDLKHPEYQDDGDGIYWLLYENKNGIQFLTKKEPIN